MSEDATHELKCAHCDIKIAVKLHEPLPATWSVAKRSPVDVLACSRGCAKALDDALFAERHGEPFDVTNDVHRSRMPVQVWIQGDAFAVWPIDFLKGAL